MKAPRLIDRFGDRQGAILRAGVERPSTLRRLAIRGWIAFGVALAAFNLLTWPGLPHPGPHALVLARLVAQIYLAFTLGWQALRSYRLAMAYRTGWLDGRLAMVEALGESMRRGMSPEDWISGELERDMAVLDGEGTRGDLE